MAERQLWSGRFAEGPSEMTLSFTSSLAVDARLAWYDVAGSLAHARMLAATGIVPKEAAEALIDGLKQLLDDLEAGKIELSDELEDVHTNIEHLLTERVGEAGKRVHTARSRNDQVATDLRMFVRDAVLEIITLLIDVQEVLIERAEEELGTIMPGFTHMQHAQPVSLGFHLMAHVFRLQRDAERFLDAYKRLNQCPLGAGALAGTGHPVDRALTAALLGFDRPTDNAMDTVSDRDFALEFVYACAQTMVHLSSMGEELVLWTSPEFRFAEMPDAFATGTSIMPQKKNPDVPELVRGKTGRVYGNLMALLTVMKSLPLAYNKDMQEDKEPLFDTVDTLTDTLRIYADMMRGITVKPDAMARAVRQGFATATDLADYLVKKGLPFRDAHEVVARAVRYAEEEKKDLADLQVVELATFSPLITPDVLDVLHPAGSLASRDHTGGTAPNQVRRQIARWKTLLNPDA